MRFEINIRKGHVFVILALLAIVGFGIAQTAPNPGHSYIQVSGIAPDCLTNPAHPSCSATSGSTWLTNHGGLDNISIASANAFSLEGFRASAFCRGDGTNCPAVSSQYVRKLPSTSFCGPGNAFYCGAQPVNVVVDPSTFSTTVSPVNPFFDFSAGIYKAGSSSGANCQWILCN